MLRKILEISKKELHFLKNKEGSFSCAELCKIILQIHEKGSFLVVEPL